MTDPSALDTSPPETPAPSTLKAEAAGTTPTPEEAALVASLAALAQRQPDLARRLTAALTVVAEEAHARPRFAARLTAALAPATSTSTASTEVTAGGSSAPRRAARRPAGPWDPYAVQSEGGEQLLRARLATLDLEQLRNIVAEHGMDTDRLAMKWRDPDRVRDRIVERVLDRSVKGEEFRSAGRPHAP